MGMYVAINGWIEIDKQQRGVVEQIFTTAHDGMYAEGWAFAARRGNSQERVFYGADLREVAVYDLLGIVRKIAVIEPVDEDLDMPLGLFVLCDERTNVWTWKIRDGQVEQRDAPELSWVFHE